MSKYKINVRVELVECDETENHEINKNNDGSFSMVIIPKFSVKTLKK